MPEPVDPKKFGLHSSARLEQSGEKEFTLIIDRKSRIIMKDGEKILEKSKKIINQVPGARVNVKTSAPVCSKTKTFLKGQGVEILLL